MDVQLVNPLDGTLIGKAYTRPAQPRSSSRLEARLPDGRYASHANDATVVHVRVRHHPGSKALVVQRRCGRRGTRGSSIGKALVAKGFSPGAHLIDATYRAQQGAKRFGRGLLDNRAAMTSGAKSVARRQAVNRDYAGLAGSYVGAAGIGVPASVAAHSLGRRKGRKDVLSDDVVKGLTYRGDPFGKSADVVQIKRWPKLNSNIPDGARNGHRLPPE